MSLIIVFIYKNHVELDYVFCYPKLNEIIFFLLKNVSLGLLCDKIRFFYISY